jgi:tetratricopeptide (TPR) repeat protein
LLLSAYKAVPVRDSAIHVRDAARRAIELDPTTAEPHTSLGLVAENFDWDWPEAEHAFKRAIGLDPKNAPAHHRYGEFLVLTGHVETGLAEPGKAEHLEPLSSLIQSDYAKCLYLARRYDEAITKAQKALSAAPNSVPPHQWLAAAYLQKGMHAEFMQEATRASVPATPFSLALRAVASGDKDKALGLLEDAVTRHDTAVIAVRMDPALDPLRADPRFTMLLGRLHLR